MSNNLFHDALLKRLDRELIAENADMVQVIQGLLEAEPDWRRIQDAWTRVNKKP